MSESYISTHLVLKPPLLKRNNFNILSCCMWTSRNLLPGVDLWPVTRDLWPATCELQKKPVVYDMWLIGWLIGWLIDWLTDWLLDEFINRLIDLLTDRSITAWSILLFVYREVIQSLRGFRHWRRNSDSRMRSRWRLPYKRKCRAWQRPCSFQWSCMATTV